MTKAKNTRISNGMWNFRAWNFAASARTGCPRRGQAMRLLDLRRARPLCGLVEVRRSPGDGGSGQPVTVHDLAGRAVGKHSAVQVDLDLAALELPANELLG